MGTLDLLNIDVTTRTLNSKKMKHLTAGRLVERDEFFFFYFSPQKATAVAVINWHRAGWTGRGKRRMGGRGLPQPNRKLRPSFSFFMQKAMAVAMKKGKDRKMAVEKDVILVNN